MKQIIFVLLSVFTFLFLSACSNNTSNGEEPKTTEVIMNLPNRTTTEELILENSVYEKVYFEMFGNKVYADIDQNLNDQLEEAKTIKEPVLDDSMKEVGSIWVQYKNSNEMVEFGKVYTSTENKMYIQAFENEYNGVLCISEGNDNSSNILF